MLYNFQEYKNGGNLYGPSQQTLEHINTYAPPYYLLVGIVDKFIEISTSLTRLRIFTLALELLIGLVIYLLIKIKTKDFLSAFLGFTTFLSLISINKFHVVIRIDYLYIFFILLSIYFLVSFKKYGKISFLLYFIVCGTISIFTKIPAIATFSTITFYHLFNYKKEARILFSIIVIVLLSSILFIITNKLTNNNFYIHTIENQLSKPLDRETARYFLSDLFFTYKIFIIPTLYLLLKYRKYFDSFYSILFASSTVESFFSIFKRGGDLNYFILPISLLCVVLFSTKKKIYEIYNIVFVVCLILLMAGGYYKKCLTASNYEQNKNLESIVANIDDEYMVTSNTYIPYMLHRKLFTNDLFQYSTNIEVKKQDIYKNDTLESSEFNYIIINPYIRKLQDFSYENFEIIYEENNSCLIQEIWRRK